MHSSGTALLPPEEPPSWSECSRAVRGLALKRRKRAAAKLRMDALRSITHSVALRSILRDAPSYEAYNPRWWINAK